MEYLTVEQAAERLGTSAQMVRRWIREGYLEAEQVGRIYLLRPGALQRFRRLPRGRPKARWFRGHDRIGTWHCTRRISANENDTTLCGKPFDLTGAADVDDKPRPRGSETVCSPCAKAWSRIAVRSMMDTLDKNR